MDEEYALSLLTRDLPDRPYDQIDRIDLRGKDCSKAGKSTKGYIYKVVAARGFERLGDLVYAGFSYDRATNLAERLKFHWAVMGCADKSIEIWSNLFNNARNSKEEEKYTDGLRRARRMRKYANNRLLERNSGNKKQKVTI